LSAWFWRRRPGVGFCLVCTPARPTRFYMLWVAARSAGLRLVDRPCRRCPGGCATIVHRDEDRVAPVPGALNGACTDITKRRVEQAASAAFGYPSLVDPTTWTGPMVDKADGNSRQDARIVEGPLRPDQIRPDRVHQRLIDSVDAEGAVVILRAAVVGGQIVWVEERRRPPEKRFVVGSALREAKTETESAMSPRERAAILAACADMGLDFGELDLLRDNADGRLYLIDVNKTASCLAPKTFSRARSKLRAAEVTGAALRTLVQSRGAAQERADR
jgi:hypothetical protein